MEVITMLSRPDMQPSPSKELPFYNADMAGNSVSLLTFLSTYVVWGRTYCDKHDWWDILCGAAIGVGSSYIFTKPYGRTRITLTPTVLQKHPGIHACITF